MSNSPNEPFVRNAWYIAAWTDELDAAPGTLIPRTIMNEPLVIFRGPDGKAAALEDRCCHRGAPLTSGALVEDGLQCGYHGLVFDGTGACVRVPGQDNVPRNARVNAYKVVERHEILWIWMGDPAAADESQIVDYPYHEQKDVWPHMKGMFPIQANYMMMIDNLMDLTHLAYVHSKTVGGSPQAHAKAELDAMATQRGCRYIRWMTESPPPPTYTKAVGFDAPIDRWHDFEYFLPSSVIQWTGAIPSGQGARENQNQPGFHIRLLHHATPETGTSFHYFWSVANGYNQGDPAATQQLYDEIFPTFLEDKEIMEVQQQRVDLDPERELVNIQADKSLFLARKALHDMIEAENAASAVAAE